MKALAPVALIISLVSALARADCPAVTDVPPFPDGGTASREEMVAAHEAFAAYNAAVDAYVECLRSNGGNAARENRAIDKLNVVARKFNAQVRAFKKRAGG